jgi:peptidoglycan/xylan/chitin deacetylase (PgdA/CDA1 family)
MSAQMPSAGIPILMYHKVAPVNPRSTLKGHYVSPRLFARQMESLVGRGYQPIRLSDLHSGRVSERSIVLTFDDGYENFFFNALPLLVRLGFPATVFLVANSLGGSNAWDVVNGDVEERLMTLAQIREARQAGIEFGSHTLDHVDLTAVPAEEARRQIVDSRSLLEDRLSASVESFCYPYGRKTKEVRDIVERAGYRLACSTEKGVNTQDSDPFALRRVNVRRDTAVPILFYKLRRELARAA